MQSKGRHEDSNIKIDSMRQFVVIKDISAFDLIHQVGEGTYGKVYKAKKKDGTLIALKKLFIKEDDKGEKKNREGFPITAIREIEILKSLNHPNIVALQGMISFSTEDSDIHMYMIFEYMEHDITGLLGSMRSYL